MPSQIFSFFFSSLNWIICLFYFWYHRQKNKLVGISLPSINFEDLSFLDICNSSWVAAAATKGTHIAINAPVLSRLFLTLLQNVLQTFLTASPYSHAYGAHIFDLDHSTMRLYLVLSIISGKEKCWDGRGLFKNLKWILSAY